MLITPIVVIIGKTSLRSSDKPNVPAIRALASRQNLVWKTKSGGTISNECYGFLFEFQLENKSD